MSFEELYDAFKKANPQLSGQEQQKRAVALWNQAKKDFRDPVERASHVKTLVKDFLIRSTKSKALNLLSYFKVRIPPLLFLECIVAGHVRFLRVFSRGRFITSLFCFGLWLCFPNNVLV